MATNDEPAGGGGMGWGGWLGVLAGLGALLRWLGGGGDRPAPVVPPAPPAVVAPAPAARPGTLPARSVGRLHVAGVDGTDELQDLVAGLSAEDRAALGLTVLLTGIDAYGVRVRATNTGSVPVVVDPAFLNVHFGGDAVGVETTGRGRFLRRVVLEPGRWVEGLVWYRARVDVGAAVRLVGGGLSYDDVSVEVTYDP